jgi:Protein of unknown function (DUF3775)
MITHDDISPPDDFPLSTDSLAFIALKARAYDMQVAPSDPDSGSNASDDREIDVLEDGADNPNARELHAAIASLNEEEKRALVALAWIGRGDFEGGEWRDALKLAGERANSRTARYLMGIPLLGDYLEEGAESLGISLTESERDGLHHPAMEPEPGEDRQ